ncbi:acetate/propionate family kinase, partial [Devosia sp.]|uniref:acetate/propionate family kinase n=1 Tax=Devosia sp. TaxID=1871048 RepID=UPI001AC7CE00
MARQRTILTLNGGSSSLKFAIFDLGRPERCVTRGQFDRVGRDGTTFSVGDSNREVGRLDHRAATDYVLEWLDGNGDLGSVVAVGHRIVHGGSRYVAPAIIDAAMLAELGRISPFAPEHLPTEMEIAAACRQRLPDIPQVACFDTAFHRSMPTVARMLAIPRRYFERGIERYGFHGLSYTYLMGVLERETGRDAARGRLVLAHLGHGASLAAVRDGKSIDTTMGFTPAAGVPMSTRSGDLDPGLVQYLARTDVMDAASFDRMVNHESGLLGISGTSGDVRDLLELESSDPRAAEALAL